MLASHLSPEVSDGQDVGWEEATEVGAMAWGCFTLGLGMQLERSLAQSCGRHSGPAIRCRFSDKTDPCVAALSHQHLGMVPYYPCRPP